MLTNMFMIGGGALLLMLLFLLLGEAAKRTVIITGANRGNHVHLTHSSFFTSNVWVQVLDLKRQSNWLQPEIGMW